MEITEAKNKLEFGKIVARIKNYLSSPLGEQLLESMELYCDRNELLYELEKLKQMRNLVNIEGAFDLTGLKDVNQMLNRVRIEGNYVSPEELLDVLIFLRISRKVLSYVNSRRKEHAESYSLIFKLCEVLFTEKILEHNIEITIDEVTGIIKDSASSELRKIRSSLRSREEGLRKTLLKILKGYSEREYSQEDIITHRDGRFVIPVKVENKRVVPGIIHSTSASGATVFIEPGETIELNNEITELKFREKREIQKILTELCSQVAKYSDELRHNADILGELDFLQAKAKYANEIDGSIPEYNDSHTELIDAYHPVLLQNHPKKDVVPLNLSIGNEFNTLIVTGPNAGGKTVALKTTGLLQIMYQSALMIPAKDSGKMRIFDKIFVNIGDEQSLDNDLSTFSSHLNSLKEILDCADENSLVLIDEICSGTDPVLGSGLASAIIDFLTKKKSVTVVTTHIGDLKKFAYNTPGVENASLEFDKETLSPSFKFVTGVPGQSFTFEIARKFDYPKDLIDAAKQYTNEEDSGLEELIKELNFNRQKYEELKNKSEIESTRLKGLANMYERKNSELKQKEREILNKAKLEAQRIISESNKLIEKTIKEIKENKQISPKEIKEKFKEETLPLIKIEEKNDEELVDQEIAEGDTVKLRDSGTTGVITKLDAKNVTVNANGISLKVNRNKVVKIKDKEREQKSSEFTNTEVNIGEIHTSLDIRGMYPSEVKHQVEKFIYDSYVNGLSEVSIIHGKGSGKLREEVKKVLQGHEIVKSSRDGKWNEGDRGVTIVEI